MRGRSLPQRIYHRHTRWELGYTTDLKGNTILSRATIDDSSNPETHVSNLGRGRQVFVWEVNNEGCITRDEVAITNNRVTVAETQAALTVCDGSTSLGGNAISSDYETGKWTILQGYAEIGYYLTKEVERGGRTITEYVVAEGYQDQYGETSQYLDEDYRVWITDPSLPRATVRKTDRGENIFRWTISSKEGGCTSYADQIVYNNAIDVYAGRDTAICTTYTDLDAKTTQYEGEWRTVAGKGNATITDPTNPKSSVGGLQPGENYLVWRVTKGTCVSVDTVIITNNTPQFDYDKRQANGDLIPLDNIADVDGETEYVIKRGDANSQRLNAAPVLVGYGQGKWELGVGGGSIRDPYDPRTEVYNMVDGTSTFIWVAENNGCKLEGTIAVTYGSAYEAEAGEDVYNLCGDTYQLKANGPFNGIGQWSIVYGTGSFDDERNPKTKVRGLQPGRNTLRWTIHYNSVDMTDTVQIWNMSVTQARAGDDRTICDGAMALQGNEIPASELAYLITNNNRVGDDYAITTSHSWELLSGAGQFAFSSVGSETEDGTPLYTAQDAEIITWEKNADGTYVKSYERFGYADKTNVAAIKELIPYK